MGRCETAALTLKDSSTTIDELEAPSSANSRYLLILNKGLTIIITIQAQERPS